MSRDSPPNASQVFVSTTMPPRWYDISAPLPGEPPRLWLCFVVGLAILVVSAIASYGGGYMDGHWAQGSMTWSALYPCVQQRTNRIDQLRLLTSQRKVASIRRKAFGTALTRPDDPLFGFADEGWSKENAKLATVRTRIHAIRIKTLRDEAAGQIILGILAALVALAGRRLIFSRGVTVVRHAVEQLGRGHDVLENWIPSYTAWVAALFGIAAGSGALSSISPSKTSGFGWNSFCLSPTFWMIDQVQVFGLSVLFAHPLAVLWVLTRPENRPSRLLMDHPDGRCGIGTYVSFLQVAMTAAVAAVSVLVVLWVEYVQTVQGAPSLVYFLFPTGILTLALCIAARVVFVGKDLRRTYLRARDALGSSWKDIQGQSPAPDPTTLLIGEYWWAVPATAIGIAASAWAALQWMGIADMVSAALK